MVHEMDFVLWVFQREAYKAEKKRGADRIASASQTVPLMFSVIFKQLECGNVRTNSRWCCHRHQHFCFCVCTWTKGWLNFTNFDRMCSVSCEIRKQFRTGNWKTFGELWSFCLGCRRRQSLCSAQCRSSIIKTLWNRLLSCVEVVLGLLRTVWRRVCIENLDHRSGRREGLCYRWKTLVPTRQTVEEEKIFKIRVSAKK